MVLSSPKRAVKKQRKKAKEIERKQERKEKKEEEERERPAMKGENKISQATIITIPSKHVQSEHRMC